MTDVDLSVTGGTVLVDGRSKRCTVGVTEGTFSHLVEPGVSLSADRTIDASGKLVLPGCADAHVHIRPGDEREGVDSGTAAAAAGGVTTIVDMPNFPPTVKNREQWNRTVEQYEQSAHVDYGIFGHIAADNVGTGAIGALAAAGVLAFKTFLSTDGGSNPYVILDKGDLYSAFEEVAATGLPFWVHAEDDEYHREFNRRATQQGLDGWDEFFESAPPILETTAVADLIDLAEKTGTSTVIAHTTTAKALDLVADAQQRGVPIHAETTPYYLGIDEKHLRDIGTRGLGTPPVRDAENRESLWGRLNDGRVDTIATDHAPRLLEEKQRAPIDVGPGMPQLETALPFLLSAANDGRVTVERVVELYAERPARLLGLYPRKGTIDVGADADFVVVDMDAEWTVDPDTFESKAKYSAFEGWTFSARVERTFLRGQEVAIDAKQTEQTPGRLLTSGR